MHFLKKLKEFFTKKENVFEEICLDAKKIINSWFCSENDYNCYRDKLKRYLYEEIEKDPLTIICTIILAWAHITLLIYFIFFNAVEVIIPLLLTSIGIVFALISDFIREYRFGKLLEKIDRGEINLKEMYSRYVVRNRIKLVEKICKLTPQY